MTAPGSGAPEPRPGRPGAGEPGTGGPGSGDPGIDAERRSGIRILAAVCIAALIAVLGITMWPTPVDRGLRGTLEAGLDALRGFGLPGWFGYPQLEIVANVVLFVPVGCLAAVLLRRRRWWIAATLPPALSIAIECAQLVFLPGRFATLSDVIANSVGGWIGIALVAAVRRGSARRGTARRGTASRGSRRGGRAPSTAE